MYFFHRQPFLPTAIDYASFANFTSTSKLNLVVAKNTVLEVYTVSAEKKLLHTLEYELSGKIKGLSVIRLAGKHLDSLMIVFDTAKVSIISFDEKCNNIFTECMKYFEKEEYRTEGFNEHLIPLLTVDPTGRAASIRVYSEYFAYFPFSTLVEDDEPIFQSSKIIKFTEIYQNLVNIIDMQFLCEFHEPTIGFIFEPKQTFVGRLSVVKDTVNLLIATFDFEHKSYPVLQKIEKLPFDTFKIISLPNPVGGVLLFTPNIIIHVDQSSIMFAVGVNSFASLSTNFAHKKLPNFELNLEQLQTCQIAPNQLLLSLKNGDLFVMEIVQEGRKISDLKLTKIANLTCASQLCAFKNLVFLASRLADSHLVLLQDSKETLNGSTKMELDDEFDELYAKDSEKDQPVTYSNQLELVTMDSLLNVAPLKDFSVGFSSTKHPELNIKDLEVVCCSNYDKYSSLSIFQQHIKPLIKDSFPMAAKACWSLKTDQFDKYLILSNETTTMVLESKSKSIEEMESSHLYLEGPTMYVTIFEKRVFQIYSFGYRILDFDLKMISESRFDFSAISASSCQNFLVILTQNGKLQIIDMAKSNVLNYEHQSEIIACSLVYLKNQFLLATFHKSGLFQICELLNFSVIFTSYRILTVPKLLISEKEIATVSVDLEFQLTEMTLLTFDSKMFLLLRSDKDEIFIYEQFYVCAAVAEAANPAESEMEIRFSKIDLKLISKDLRKNTTFGQIKRTSLIAFDNISNYSGVFVAGKRPIWLLWIKERQKLVVHSMAADSEIYSMASFCSEDCQAGFIYNTLRICEMEKWNYDLSWPFKKIKFDERNVENIAFHNPTETYVMASSVSVPFHLAEIEGDSAKGVLLSLTEGDSEIAGSNPALLPKTKQFELQLLSPITWEVVDLFKLMEHEYVMTVKSVILDSKQSSSGMSPFIVVGTAFVRGEDRQTRGRVLIFDIIEVVPEPDNPQTNHKLKLLFQDDLKGPVAAVGAIFGRLVTSSGTKIMIHEFEDCESLNGVAFADVQIFGHTLTTIKNFVYYGDCYKSSAFLAFSHDPTRLVQLSKDYQSMSVLAVEFIVDNEHLFMVSTDTCGNIHVFSYSPHNLLTMGGQKLLKRAEFHSASRISRLMRLPSNYKRLEFILYASSEGTIGCVSSLQEKMFKRLQMLYLKMTHLVPQPCNLNVKSFRLLQEEKRKLGVSAKTILDGNFLYQFVNLSRNHQKELAKAIGSSVDKIIEDLVEIEYSMDVF